MRDVLAVSELLSERTPECVGRFTPPLLKSLSLLKCLKQSVENHKTNDKVVAITDQRRTIIRTFQKILI